MSHVLLMSHYYRFYDVKFEIGAHLGLTNQEAQKVIIVFNLRKREKCKIIKMNWNEKRVEFYKIEFRDREIVQKGLVLDMWEASYV